MENEAALTLPYKDSKDNKTKQVRCMFDRISASYDLVNRVLSGGVDLYWRKKAAQVLAQQAATHVLDLAAGTGDMAIAVAKSTKARITAADISEKMIAIAQRKIKKKGLAHRIAAVQVAPGKLPFPDGAFDAVTIAFGIRNFEHVKQTLMDLRRVLRPSGRLVVLELSTPRGRYFSWLYDVYFSRVLSFLGGLLSGHRQAYRYLHRSVKSFSQGSGLMSLLETTHFTHVQHKTLTGGICSLYVARR